MLKVNRNIFWSNLLIDFLVNNGVKFACISPGSRSTPLTIAAVTNKSIKTLPIIDERSSAFFALGLSKSTKSPTLIITTSGTAVAELYPAIIEAYQSRTPLIVCTADRPSRLRGTGANQTINQNNIFKNHISFSADIPSFDINSINIKKFLMIISEGKEKCLLESSPVHFNLQFDKPFEPDSYTDEISLKIIENSTKLISDLTIPDLRIKHKFEQVSKISLITIGYDYFDKHFLSLLNEFSKNNNIPVFADIGSGLRSQSIKINNLIYNYDTLVRSESFSKFFNQSTVLHFGRSLTSNSLEEFLTNIKAKKIVVNQFGDRFDSTKKAKIIKSDPISYLNYLLNIEVLKNSEQTLNSLLHIDSQIEKLKSKVFGNSFTEFEIISTLTKHLQDNSNLFIGNSLPIRDFDFLISHTNKTLNIFTNRGASGIDGIISTASGICFSNTNPTYLVLGDLSFYYDINSLLSLKKFEIPLKIIIINNDGGRIFEYLPISNYKNVFKEFFLTSTGLNFSKIAESFSIKYLFADNHKDYISKLEMMNKLKTSVILEVKVNPFRTKSLKKKFREETNNLISKVLI